VKGSRTAVYVDGAAFHRGERLRRDRAIRQRLQESETPWEVITLTAGDLNDASKALARVCGDHPTIPAASTAAPRLSTPAPPSECPEPASAHPSRNATDYLAEYEILAAIEGGG